MAWSWSRVEMYRSCPLKYCLRYLEQVPVPPEPPSEILAIGTIGHSVLQKVFETGAMKKALLAQAARSVPEYRDYRERELMAIINRAKPTIRELLKEVKRADLKGVEDWWRVDEKWKEVERGAMIVGRTDLWWKFEDKVNVLDHKLGSSRNAQKDQLKFYACLCPVEAKFVRVANFFVPEARVSDWMEFSRQEIAGMRRAFMKEIRQIQENKKGWPAQLGRYCSWCTYKARCNTYSRTVQQEEVI